MRRSLLGAGLMTLAAASLMALGGDVVQSSRPLSRQRKAKTKLKRRDDDRAGKQFKIKGVRP